MLTFLMTRAMQTMADAQLGTISANIVYTSHQRRLSHTGSRTLPYRED